MNFDELFANVCAALRREQRISYRALRRRFELSDDDLEDLKVELIEAKQLAQSLSHPYSRAFVVETDVSLAQFRLEAHVAQKPAEALVALGTEHDFPWFVATGTMFRGWVLAQQGQSEAGIAQLHQGIAMFRTTGELALPHWLSLPDLNALMDGLRFLTSFAVEIRYPGTFAEPQDAEDFSSFMQSQTPLRLMFMSGKHIRKPARGLRNFTYTPSRLCLA